MGALRPALVPPKLFIEKSLSYISITKNTKSTELNNGFDWSAEKVQLLQSLTKVSMIELISPYIDL